MKIFISEHTFEHPWETVVHAAVRKYPNPLNPNVTGLDVVNRTVDRGVLKTQKLMTTQWALPGWVNRFLGVMNPSIHVNEKSEVDLSKKSMVLTSKNITMGNYINIDEKLEYVQHPDKPNCTLQRHQTIIGVTGIPMAGYLEDLVKGTCSSNSHKGRESIEWVINTLKEETVHSSNLAEASQSITKTAEEQLHHLSKSAEQKMHNLTKISEEQIDSIKSSFSSNGQQL